MDALTGTKSCIFEEMVPFSSCHASTLALMSNGDLLAAWFGGTCEGDPDVDIWISRCHKGAWSYPVKAAEEEGLPHWNPVLFKADNGNVYLFYKVGHTFAEWYTRVTVSDDDGQTWSPPKELVHGDRGGRGPVRNKPIVLQNRAWVAPSSLEQEAWEAFVDISLDQGNTWMKSEVVPAGIIREPGKGVIQPTLWESSPNHVHMLLRSTEGFIYRSDSSDGGKSWCEAYATPLPNNNSGIDLVRTEGGMLALVHNPVGGNWGPRTPLVVSLSEDEGLRWKQAMVLEEGEGEFSYPAIVSANGKLHITYTWNRKTIAYWELNI